MPPASRTVLYGHNFGFGSLPIPIIETPKPNYTVATVTMATFLKLVVRNDAMKEDPPEIYGWRVYALAISVMPPSSIEGSG